MPLQQYQSITFFLKMLCKCYNMTFYHATIFSDVFKLCMYHCEFIGHVQVFSDIQNWFRCGSISYRFISDVYLLTYCSCCKACKFIYVLLFSCFQTDRHFCVILLYGQVDSAANVQPENVADIWNLRGILNTSWHRVRVRNALHIANSNL